MGTDVHVVVVGERSERLADEAMRRIDELEALWSRFEPDSEISRCNAASGQPVATTPETRLLVRCGVLGWERSTGIFDPTVHDAVVAAGYDRDFAAVLAREARRCESTRSDMRTVAVLHPRRDTRTPVPGCGGIVVDDARGTVMLPAGTRLDPGGIGKGLAADLVVEGTRAAGADGVCVNLGGDLRVAGSSPAGGPWLVALPAAIADEAAIALTAGAVATSSTTRRHWGPPGDVRHHVIDPFTGTSADAPQRTATVIAPTGWEAEVAAKVMVLADDATRDLLVRRIAKAGAVANEVGEVRTTAGFDAFVVPSSVERSSDGQ